MNVYEKGNRVLLVFATTNKIAVYKGEKSDLNE